MGAAAAAAVGGHGVDAEWGGAGDDGRAGGDVGRDATRRDDGDVAAAAAAETADAIVEGWDGGEEVDARDDGGDGAAAEAAAAETAAAETAETAAAETAQAAVGETARVGGGEVEARSNAK